MNLAEVAAFAAGVTVVAAAAALPWSDLPGSGVSGPQRPTPPWAQHALAAALVASVGAILAGPGAAVLLGAIAAAASVLRERRTNQARRAARERAMPSMARAVADALRGGSSVRGALAEAAVDRSVPIALRDELTEVAGSVRLGASLDSALERLAGAGGPGLRLLCGTVVMHLEAGGALAGELERLAEAGEVALRIDEDRVAATAQARATVRVVAALPVIALAGAEVASRDFLPTIAARPLALALLLLGMLLEGAAIIAARAIVRPH